jgi:hypothetical protein
MKLSASLAAAGFVCGVVVNYLMWTMSSSISYSGQGVGVVWVAAGTIAGAIIGAAGDITREIRRSGR